MTHERALRRPTQLPSLALTLSLFVGATLLANFVAAVSNQLLAHLVHTPSDLTAMAELQNLGHGAVITLLAFIVPSVLATLYMFPIYRACYLGRFDASLPLAQRRLLNLPLVLGLIGLFGWFINIADLAPAALSNPTPDMLRALGMTALDSFLIGSLVFVLSYYLLEFIIRKYFIPAFFPGGRLSECRGTLALSIQARFYIFFFAVAIYPLLVMLNVARALGEEGSLGDRLTWVTLLVGVVLLLGALLVYLIARSYQMPLVEMARAAQRIQASDYAVDVAVVSNDEVGRLGEALNAMAAELKEKEFIKDTFGKVVDPRVRDHLLGGHIQLGGEVREAAILFTDIRDFTPLSAEMKPDQVVEWLNRYFERMSQCIVEEGGLVNRYIGDAILAVFGVPVPLDNPAAAAVRAGVKMMAAREVLNLDLRRAGLPPVRSGIGIHSGPVLAGNIGSSSRMEYTVIGDAVNVTARIEKLCKEMGTDLLLSETAAQQIGGDFRARDLGPTDIRGKEQPLRLFGLE